jgi:predicted ATPase/DNA-binding CsgD family transcriptional regulator
MDSPAASRSPGAEQRRAQLPAEVSGFVGRRGELTRLGRLLDGARLVTVAGPGGVGKSRLALRAAAARGAGGCCLVELSSLTDPELLPDTVALRLGLHADPVDQLAAVLSALRDRELLLILDTCEHLTGACARFATAVLRETRSVKILATSRQPLHVPGEEVLRLGPLPVPALDQETAGTALAGTALAGFSPAGPMPAGPGAGDTGAGDTGAGDTGAGDAVELFTQRAAAAVSGFTVTPADRPHVIRLCRRLDGIPLAIELAAVRVRVLPVAELAARVEAGLAAGTGTRRGLVSRHQTLHAAIDWSYGLCTEAERAAWRRLSVFAGTFGPTAARELVAGDDVPADQAEAVIGGLVDKSVVLPVGGGRHRLLDSVREYGAERLAESGEDAERRERQLAWYLRLSSDFSHHLVSDGQRERLSRLRAEHPNIRGALEFGLNRPRAATAAQAEAAARLAAALYPYWFMSGSIREGIYWQDKTLAWFTEQSPPRASALANRALLAAMAGLAGADEQAGEALAMAARLGDERTHARAYLALNFALNSAGRYDEALEAARQARWRLEALGAGHALLTLDMHFALSYILAGDFDAALDHSQHLLSRLSPGEQWLRGNAYALSALAYYPQPARQAECADAAYAALRASAEIGSLVGAAYSLEVLGWLAAGAGRAERAAWLLGAAQARWERAGGRLSGSLVLEGYHQRAQAGAASTLGTARYDALHAAGAARPLAEVAELALADADALPAPPPDPARPADPARDGRAGDGLTVREREIAGLVGRGLSNREIAERLVISRRTVDAHVNHIFGKLGLSSRVQLAIWLGDRGLAQALPPAARA